jgi:hypothetical protein
MFGSQAIEVAIGLVLAFFLLATAASAVVEVISALWDKRAKDLDAALDRMQGASGTAKDLVGKPPSRVQDTSVFQAISPPGVRRGILPKRWGTVKPSYLSAKAFADAVAEMIVKAKHATTTADELYDALPQTLRDRLQPIVSEVEGDATAIKAGLESWFDDTMARLEGSYKRWAQIWLFVVALALVIGANASAYRMADVLYRDPAVRSAVTQSATATATAGQSSDPATITDNLDKVADTVSSLDSLGLPVGWHHWNQPGGTWATILGWLVTALLVMLGAPFWFGVLTKLVSLRSTGERPSKALDDSTSATRQIGLRSL